MHRPSRHVTFEGSAGAPLAARLDVPAGPPRAHAVFAHCFTCSKDLFAAGRIAAELTAQGIAVLRFDFTGLGSSGGEFADTTFSSNLEDLRRAVAWMAEELAAPQLLIGHSLGGAAVLSVAPDLPDVRAVATIGAPSDVEHITHLFVDHLERLETEGVATVDIGGRPFTVRRDLLDDLAGHSVIDRAARLGAALLVLHSPIDNVVRVEHAGRIFGAARHPRSFVALDGADHLLSRHADATYAARVIATWSERHVRDLAPAAPPPASTAPVVVAETGQGMFLNHVVAGEHRFLADEPTDVGGFDAGPSPYDLLAAALGACTSMTLRMYAERKSLRVERITVEVSHDRVHRTDGEGAAAGEGPMIDRFRRRVIVDGDVDDATRASLLRIADRCPVHKTLTASSVVETELALV